MGTNAARCLGSEDRGILSVKYINIRGDTLGNKSSNLYTKKCVAVPMRFVHRKIHINDVKHMVRESLLFLQLIALNLQNTAGLIVEEFLIEIQ
jgi:hypothetical protein